MHLNELEWIVVHGHEVWVAALGALVTIGAALGLLAARARRAARTRAALRLLGEPQDKGLREEGARVTMVGRWAGGRVTSAFAAGTGSRALLATRLGRLADLENLRLCAVAAGDREAAEELGRIVARHRRALLRRETLVPLAVLEGLVLEGAADEEI